MEFPGHVSAPGGASTNDADRQTHQRGFSFGRLDPARQHHDAGAGHDGIRAAPTGVDAGGGCAIAVIASGGGGPGAGGGQETGCAQASHRADAADAGARGAHRAGSVERLMLLAGRLPITW